MIGAFDVRANEGVDRRVVGDVRTGLDLTPGVGRHRRLGEDLARQAHACAHLGPIVRMAHIIEADRRLVDRIGAAQADMAAALRSHRPDMRLEAVAGRERRSVVADRQRQEVILDVRIGDPGTAADEAAAFEMIGRTQSAFPEQPARADQRLSQRIHRRIEGDRKFGFDLEIEFQMVLQILANARKIVDRRNAMRAQFVGRADPRQLQQLRRIDRPACQDHLTPGVDDRLHAVAAIDDPRRPSPVEDDAAGQRMGHHGQVRAAHRRFEIGAGGAPAASAMDGHVHPAEAFLLIAVDVRRFGIARFARGVDEGAIQRIGQLPILRVERPGVAAPGVPAFLPRFRAPEIGQHMTIAPAGRPFPFPPIEIGGIAAHIDHAVDRGRTADHLAARRMHPSTAQMRLRLRLILPIVARHVHRDRQRAGHLDEDRAIGPALFEHQHAMPSILGQPGGEHAPRRSGADDDVIEAVGHQRYLNRGSRCRPSRHRRSSDGYNVRWQPARFHAQGPRPCSRRTAARSG